MASILEVYDILFKLMDLNEDFGLILPQPFHEKRRFAG